MQLYTQKKKKKKKKKKTYIKSYKDILKLLLLI